MSEEQRFHEVGATTNSQLLEKVELHDLALHRWHQCGQIKLALPPLPHEVIELQLAGAQLGSAIVGGKKYPTTEIKGGGFLQVQQAGVEATVSAEARCDVLHVAVPSGTLSSISSRQTERVIEWEPVHIAWSHQALGMGLGLLVGMRDRTVSTLQIEEFVIEVCESVLAHQPVYPVGRTKRPLEKLSGRQLGRVIDLLENNPTASVRLADLADEVRMSESHFARAFRNTTGIPPHQYLLRLRVRRAADLLRFTSHALSEVAVLLGFTDQSAFTNVFRRFTGVTPGAYRALLVARTASFDSSPISPTRAP
jgi:AraC-like DNA-binding protein